MLKMIVKKSREPVLKSAPNLSIDATGILVALRLSYFKIKKNDIQEVKI